MNHSGYRYEGCGKRNCGRKKCCSRWYVAAVVFCVLFLMGCGDRAITFEQLEPESTAESVEDAPKPTAESVENASEETVRSGENTREEGTEDCIYVYVCGAVQNPGVVVLAVGSRGVDALEAAGGFTEEAAASAVNLAEILTDGLRWYIPTVEEAGEHFWTGGQEGADQQDRTTGILNLNTATEEQLCTLPGIGKSKAAAIVAYRKENGLFEKCEDLMKVAGIKENVYEKVRNLIKVE